MRKILASSMILASALFVAGCASSNAIGNQDNSSLNGQYVFSEQVYTYFVAGLPTAPAPHAASANPRFAHPLTHIAELPRRDQRLAGMLAHRGQARHFLPAALKNAVPDQGDQNNSVAWGAAVGSLTFDGNGNVTAGELDFNEPSAGGYYAEAVNGTYSVDSNRVGVISLSSTNGDGHNYNYQITLQGSGQATGAQLLEGESDNQGDVEIGDGQMLQQSSGQTQATLSGNYVFGAAGQTCYGCTQTTTGDLFAAGVLAADGAGNFGAAGQADISTGFATDNKVGISGTYSAPDANGRSTATFTATGYTHGVLPSAYVIYAANSSTAFLMSTDQSATGLDAAYLLGEMNLQSGTLSLSGKYVVGETTEDLQNETVAQDTFSDAFIALLTTSGGMANGTGDINKAGIITSAVPFTYGAYTVAANGRVALSGTTPSGARAPVFYVSGSGIGYGVDQLNGNSALQEPGLLYLFAQTGSSFSNSSLNGNYALGDLESAVGGVGLDVNGGNVGTGLINGELMADGNGNLNAVNSTDAVEAFINGTGANGDLTGTYAIDSTGRGTIVGSTTDSNTLFGNEVFYLANTGQALALDDTQGNSAPVLQIIQQ